MYSRRQLGRLALGAFPAAAAFADTISLRMNGVQVGLAAYSLNTLPRQGLIALTIQCMLDAGLGDCVLYGPAIEPSEFEIARRGRAAAGPEQAAALEALRKWHLTVSLDYYRDIRTQFDRAGIELGGYDPVLGATPSPEEMDNACQVTRTLGAGYLMVAVNRSVAKPLASIAEKHGVKVGLQGHPNMKSAVPDQMSKPADFEEALGLSKNFALSIDAGDATGGGYDVLRFLEDHHERIFALYLKDRRKDNLSVPWGEGDSHIKDLLQTARDNKYPCRFYIDCDYATAPAGSRIADVKKCAEFARAALA